MQKIKDWWNEEGVYTMQKEALKGLEIIGMLIKKCLKPFTMLQQESNQLMTA